MSRLLQVLVKNEKLQKLAGVEDFLACRSFVDDLLSLARIRIDSARGSLAHFIAVVVEL